MTMDNIILKSAESQFETELCYCREVIEYGNGFFLLQIRLTFIVAQTNVIRMALKPIDGILDLSMKTVNRITLLLCDWNDT